MLNEMLMGAGALGTLYVHLSAESSKLVREMGEAEHVVTRSSERIVKQVKILAAGMSAAFAVIGYEALKEWLKFDKAMTESTAIMGDLSEKLKKQMGGLARTLSEDTIQSADQLAQTYYFLASAGLNVKQQMAALPVVTRFATAGVFDLSTATTLASDAQAALGLKVEDTEQYMKNLTRVTDVLVKANILANANVQQFSEALTNKAAAALRTVGKDIEEGVSVLANFADQGLKGAAAGEALAIVMRDLQRAALNSREMMKGFGVTVFNTSGEMRNIADIIEDLEKVLEGASDEQKRMAFQLMGFQDRSLAAILALVGTSGKIREYEQALRQAGVTTKEVADKQLESLSNQLRISKNRFDELLLIIGESLAPVLRRFNDQLKELLSSHSDLTKEVKIFSETYGESLLFIGKMAWRMWSGVRDVFKSLMVIGLQLNEWFLKVVLGIVQAISFAVETAVKTFLRGVNAIIGGINLAVVALPEGIRRQLGIGKMNKVAEDFILPFSDTIEKKMQFTLEVMREMSGKWVEDLSHSSAEASHAVQDHAKETTSAAHEIKDAGKMVQEAWEATAKALGIATKDMTHSLNRVQQVIDATKIDKLITMLGLPPRSQQAALPTAKELMDSLTMGEGGSMDDSKVIERLRQAGVDSGGGANVELESHPLKTGIFKTYADEIQTARNKLRILQDLGNQEVLLTLEVQKKKNEAIRAQADQNKMVQEAWEATAKALGDKEILLTIEVQKKKNEAIKAQAASELELLEELQKKRLEAVDAYNLRINQLVGGQVNELLKSSGFEITEKGPKQVMGDDMLTGQSFAIEGEIKMNQDKLAALRELGNSEVELTEEIQKKKAEAIEAFTQRAMQLTIAQTGVIAASWKGAMGDMAEAVKGFAGEQSGIYQAMFAASKAFAIAEATVKIMQGVANAASLPFPANLAAMASVIAATASIITNIQSVQLTFGGKKEKGGPVNPDQVFLVGEKGPELFVPPMRGDIIPNHNILPVLTDLSLQKELKENRIVNTVEDYKDLHSSIVSREEKETINRWKEMVTGVSGTSKEKESASIFLEGRGRGGSVEKDRPFLVGEDGPELFVPSSRGDIISNEEILVDKKQEVKVIVNNYTDSRASVTEREEGGSKIIEVLVQRVKGDMASEVREGRGLLPRALETAYALRRGRG